MIGYLKLAGVIAGAVAVAGLGWYVKGKFNDAARVPELEAKITSLEETIAIDRKNQAEVQETSRGLQSELETLRDAAARERVPVVRLCRNPVVPEPAAVPAAARGLDAALAAAGLLPPPPAGEPEPGPDIGADLFADADRADAVTAQARALQSYATGCSRAP